MVMTLRLDDDAADALRRLAEREQRSAEDIARQAIREHVERVVIPPAGPSGRDALAGEIDQARTNSTFVETLDSLATRDQEILDRLAE